MKAYASKTKGAIRKDALGTLEVREKRSICASLHKERKAMKRRVVTLISASRAHARIATWKK